ncbi:MAG TPA: ABC transporter permease [Candidatus Saccharimonadales bacterium]|nr:ABC transporter permease [Candidatus Saccharimonadales bacterium]
MIFENISMALRSIAGNKLRTFLTMLGIIIGVGAVVAINSLGQGLKQVVTQEVSNLGADVLVITSGKTGISSSSSGSKAGGGGGGGGGGFASSLGTSTLTEQDITTVQNDSHVSVVAPLSLISGIVERGTTQDPSALIMATSPDFLKADPSEKLGSGRFLTAADNDSYVAVIGSDTSNTLFGSGTNAIGKTVTLRGHSFTVVGVLASSQASQGGSSFGATSSLDDIALIPTNTAKTLTGSTLQIYRILAQAKSKDDVQPAVNDLTNEIKANHGGQDDFSVLTQQDILNTFNTIFDALTGAISAIAGISLLVGGIGIMNIMLVSVTERTREIGLRKALGATSGMVLSQFLIEAVVLTVIGGMLGVAFAYGLGHAVGHFAKLTPVFTVGTIATATIISAVIGIVFGIAPAIKASRMKPIDALRYE